MCHIYEVFSFLFRKYICLLAFNASVCGCSPSINRRFSRCQGVFHFDIFTPPSSWRRAMIRNIFSSDYLSQIIFACRGDVVTRCGVEVMWCGGVVHRPHGAAVSLALISLCFLSCSSEFRCWLDRRSCFREWRFTMLQCLDTMLCPWAGLSDKGNVSWVPIPSFHMLHVTHALCRMLPVIRHLQVFCVRSLKHPFPAKYSLRYSLLLSFFLWFLRSAAFFCPLWFYFFCSFFSNF